jgi:class 3 adenylate cyclase/pimeloyl-ACP methyl ester carboxylesterase
MEREVRYCTTEDGVRIAYSVAGAGPALVFAPLFIESFSLFHLLPEVETFLAKLATIRRVVLYDGRGTGLSQRDAPLGRDTARWDIEGVIAAIDEMPVALWANFGSTPAALRIAANSPGMIERLVVFAGFAWLQPVFSDDQLLSFAGLARTNWPLAAQTFGDMSTRQADPAAGARFGEIYRESTSGETMARFFESLVHDADDARDCLGRITVPTLVLHRKGDLNVPIEFGRQIAATIPGARFVPLDGVMSHPALGDQEQVLRSVMPFLDTGEGRHLEADRSGAAAAFRAVLFTDLVGHTEMMSRLGDEAGRAVLREHERITREVLNAHGGTEVKTMGDGFMASFGSVTKAVECAIALQRAVAEREGEPLNVRVGLNAGEPIEEDGDLFGATVILASRIAAKAEGGEILVADTVRGLCSGKGFVFADRGDFVAKGIEEPVRIWEVSWRS